MPGTSEIEIANAVAPEAPAKPLSFVEQYELGDDAEHNAELDLPPQTKSKPAPVEAAEETKSATPPRGPDGKFLPKSENEAPVLSARLLRLAEDVGLSEDDLEGASKEQVEDMIYAANRSAAKMRKAESILEVKERRPIATEGDNQQVADEFDAIIEGGFAPELVEPMRAMSARIKQLEDMVQNLGRFEHQRQVETFASKLDLAIDALGMPNLFGEGRGIEMDPDSLEFKRRLKIAEEIEKDKSRKPFKAKVEAAGMLFGFTKGQAKSPQPPAAARPATNGHEEEGEFEQNWRKGALNRPTNRIATEVKGERKAIQTAANYMRENGMVDEDEATSKDGFL